MILLSTNDAFTIYGSRTRQQVLVVCYKTGGNFRTFGAPAITFLDALDNARDDKETDDLCNQFIKEKLCE